MMFSLEYKAKLSGFNSKPILKFYGFSTSKSKLANFMGSHVPNPYAYLQEHQQSIANLQGARTQNITHTNRVVENVSIPYQQNSQLPLKYEQRNLLGINIASKEARPTVIEPIQFWTSHLLPKQRS